MTSHRNATSIFIVFVVVVLAAMLSRLLNDPFNDQDFDRATWGSSKPRKRARMATDLIENHLDQGMKQIEVIELLGEPDATRDETDLYSVGSWRFSRGGSGEKFVHIAYGTGARVMFMKIGGF